jgi:hypothetical protein
MGLVSVSIMFFLLFYARMSKASQLPAASAKAAMNNARHQLNKPKKDNCK